MNAVEVGDHRIDVQVRRRGIQDRCEGVSQLQVVLTVDLDRRELGHHHSSRPTEEAVPAGPEASSRHRVKGACFPEVRISVLPARSVARVMILSGDQAVGTNRAPQEFVGFHG